MPEGLLIAGAIVGLVGGTIGILSGGWSLVERIVAAYRKRKPDPDYDITKSYF